MKHDADDGVTISETSSVCPSCLAIIPARVFERDGKVWMGKSCRKHGRFEELYWGDAAMFRRAMRWAHDGKGIANPKVAKGDPVCPQDCGLCSMHKSHTALANIALTTRCDRNCFYCFFYAGKLGYVYEPSMGQIREMLSNLRNEKPVPCNAVQLTGGEPTLREDLVDIIRMCKEEGFDHVQLNTNGIRLGRDPALALKVRQAGVNTLYLSFDGITPKTNPKNHWEIPATLDSCRKADMGVVLVPTVIKGTNDHEAADILRFGFRNIDVVRSVNFQPVSLVGMMPREERLSHRITIPDVIKSIEEGTGGQVAREDFYPVPTVASITSLVEALTGKAEYDLSAHFACGMATYVFQDGKGGMLPVTRFVDVEGFFEYLGSQAEALKSGRNRYVAMLGMLRKIGSFIDKEKAPKGIQRGRHTLQRAGEARLRGPRQVPRARPVRRHDALPGPVQLRHREGEAVLHTLRDDRRAHHTFLRFQRHTAVVQGQGPEVAGYPDREMGASGGQEDHGRPLQAQREGAGEEPAVPEDLRGPQGGSQRFSPSGAASVP